jgi:hypothetical protein
MLSVMSDSFVGKIRYFDLRALNRIHGGYGAQNIGSIDDFPTAIMTHNRHNPGAGMQVLAKFPLRAVCFTKRGCSISDGLLQ